MDLSTQFVLYIYFIGVVLGHVIMVYNADCGLSGGRMLRRIYLWPLWLSIQPIKYAIRWFARTTLGRLYGQAASSVAAAWEEWECSGDLY